MKSIASRLWHRQLRIAIHPDRVCIGRVASERQVEVTGARVIDVKRGQWPWDAPLAALRKEIFDFSGRDVMVKVSLSNHFVRYALVPWRDRVAGPAEQVAFAQHCFKNLFGAPAAHWDIRVSDGGYGRNALASAVDREWMVGLDRIFAEHRLKRISIQPWFMTACNRYRTELGRHPDGCIAVIEPGRVALGIYDRFGWQSLSVRKIEAADPRLLSPILAQELLSANLGALPDRLFVITIGSNSCSLLRSRTRNWITPIQARVPGLFSWKNAPPVSGKSTAADP
jgi:hypothetical protein